MVGSDARTVSSGATSGPAARDLSERDWQRQVTDLAVILGWEWLHFRPAETQKGWRTPVSGSLAEGWVDLVLVRPPRLILAELKRQSGRTTPAQDHWLDLLQRCPGVEVHLWRPAELDQVMEVLR